MYVIKSDKNYCRPDLAFGDDLWQFRQTWLEVCGQDMNQKDLTSTNYDHALRISSDGIQVCTNRQAYDSTTGASLATWTELIPTVSPNIKFAYPDFNCADTSIEVTWSWKYLSVITAFMTGLPGVV
jgi:hypothetical protein